MSWLVVNTEREKEREVESRAEAEETRDNLISIGASPEDLEIVPPNKSDRARGRTETDGGTETIEPDVVDNTDQTEEPARGGYDLPDKPPVDEDPITWMPDEFTDVIEGKTAINRKGYEVMAHHYGIGTESRCIIGPEETEFEFCRVVATATKDDGTQYEAHGSAHVDRGDDSFLLLEMADTRARKRSIAQATGVGMVAVSELQNEVMD